MNGPKILVSHLTAKEPWAEVKDVPSSMLISEYINEVAAHIVDVAVTDDCARDLEVQEYLITHETLVKRSIYRNGELIVVISAQ
ncbi:hypothetical protein D3C87_953020 [compost metagenome]